ncbi:MAG: valine--tRNA ligase [Candidatus Woesearchaeota archaeon]
MELPQNYDPKVSEPKWQKYWQEKDIFTFNPKDKRPIYSIDTPPPTVSGKMHIGHAFSYTQEDFIARYKKMRGFNVYYPFGTDDNGLPTDKLVEKLKKVRSRDFERQEYIKLCNDTVKEIKPDFVQDWINIGMSCDFKSTYSTIDPYCVKTSQASFLDLYKKGLIYRRKEASMWCWQCQTAIAQAELDDVEEDSFFNFLIFKVKETNQNLEIATTRPELLPACVAVFVHPEDARYKNLIGKHAIVPLFNHAVPILGDESANPEKGTGVLMICSYGDRFDAEAIKRFKLNPINSITKDGKMNEIAKEFNGLKIKEARDKIIEKLKELNLITKQNQIKHALNTHDKCGTPIEFLASEQWFINVLDHKQALKDRANEITWYPEHMKVRYDHWVENLNWDWCISRQRHFGVPFPLWYSKKTGEVILAEESQLPVDPLKDFQKKLPAGHKKEDLVPEIDVMDTWATSSVTPQIISNWIKDKNKKELKFEKLFPLDLRPQAHDIIRTWAFYTIVKSHYHHNSIPWKNIMVSGYVLDPKGEKMSKSKGNVVAPQEVIQKYSADGLRFWAGGSNLGDDLPYLEKDLVTGQKFITKLWNASKFGLMHLEDYTPHNKQKPTEMFDKWLLSKLQRLIKESTLSFEGYEYSKSKAEVEKFFWHTFCDQYMEIVKERLYNPQVRGIKERESAQLGVYSGILGVLKMIAPIMPHITEEIYQLYFAQKENLASIHLSKWPELNAKLIDDTAEEIGDVGIDIINVVRKFKSENKMSMKDELQEMTIISDISDFQKKIKKIEADLKAVTKVKKLKFKGETSFESERFKLKIGLVK